MKHIIIFIAVIGFYFSACNVPKELNPEKNISLPASYDGDTTQNSATLIDWHSYFKDPYLKDLIDTALVYNIDLQMANQRIFASRAQFVGARNELFPQINAAVSTGVTRFGDYTMDGVGNFDTNKSPNISEDQKIPNPIPDYYVGLQTSWEVNFTGKLQNRKKARFNRYLASEEGKKYLCTQLVAEIAQTYYELLVLDAELAIINSNIKLQEKGLEVVQIQKQSGRINELAVKQFKAQLYNFKALENSIAQDINTTENRLNTLIGRYPQKVARKDTLNAGDLPSFIQTGVPAALLQNRTDVLAAERELLASQLELKSARASFYPNLTITANMGMNAFKSALWFDPASLAFNVIGGLGAPILNRARVMQAYKEAYASKNEAFLKYQKTILTSVEEVSTQLNSLKNYQKVSEYKALEVKTLKEAVDISNELFVTGYANYVEVLIARQNRLLSEIQLAEALKQQYIASIRLYKALGGGWK